jgi:hypothetical protein
MAVMIGRAGSPQQARCYRILVVLIAIALAWWTHALDKPLMFEGVGQDNSDVLSLLVFVMAIVIGFTLIEMARVRRLQRLMRLRRVIRSQFTYSDPGYIRIINTDRRSQTIPSFVGAAMGRRESDHAR